MVRLTQVVVQAREVADDPRPGGVPVAFDIVQEDMDLAAGLGGIRRSLSCAPQGAPKMVATQS